ncbi:MAG: anthranilate phosphoribosyltransferase [Halieaceae bacterium]|jgi:anthranilate phosphoribosyltransferase|nr:anthranilate phosphoribosyltransferase [Halieaceae bacterium]
MNIQQAIERLVESADINSEEMRSVMRQVMGGEASAAQIGAFLVALRIKGETIDEIAAATEVMRELATPVTIEADHLVDIVGTGGDGANLFNVSTASSFVAAAAGAHVAKHGNRSVSSTSGSSDVLQALGVNLELSPEQVARCVQEVGMGFMFAPQHHSAMKHAAGPRKELGLRTVFNMLGPMTNPAGVRRQLIGVFDPGLCRPMAEVLKRLGSEHIMVVHAHDGLDEISIASPTHVAELRDGGISEYEINPTEFGRPMGSLDDLVVGSSDESVKLIKAALSAEHQDAANMVILNAGAAIYVSGVAPTLADGVQMADDAVASGAALQKITELRQFTEFAGA